MKSVQWGTLYNKCHENHYVDENDKIKNNYCKEHDIELIRISGNFSTEEELERYMIKNRIV